LLEQEQAHQAEVEEKRRQLQVKMMEDNEKARLAVANDEKKKR
jgi:hypothetical protein